MPEQSKKSVIKADRQKDTSVWWPSDAKEVDHHRLYNSSHGESEVLHGDKDKVEKLSCGQVIPRTHSLT